MTLGVLMGLVVSCASADADRAEAPPAPVTATPTTTIPATTTTTTTSSTTTTTTTTTTTLVRLDDTELIASIGIFGDSLVADLTEVGGRDNQVVPQLAILLEQDPDLAVERVENFGVAGQSVVSDLGMLPVDRATIRPYVSGLLDTSTDVIDLAVVAVSSSDINLNAALPEPAATEVVAEQMLNELRSVEEALRAAGVQVVFLPVFGINDTVFANLRCVLRPSCPDGPDAEVDIVNELLWDSDLPMLFDRFDQLDRDGDGRTDRTWFDDVDARYPDDGVHPNAAGQAVYANTVAAALRRVLVSPGV